jgi:hypothetical protein
VAEALQPLTVSVAGPDGATETRLILPDPAAEYRFRPPDTAVLGAVAEATGGAISPDAAALRRSGGSSRAARRALWPGLVALSLLLWLLDVLLRRVRVFETEGPAVASGLEPRESSVVQT